MRKNYSKEKKHREGEIPTGSFSDIAFLLIIYFLVATTLVKVKTITADLPSGENALRSLQLNVDPDLTKEALRTCVLQIDFDDHETVWCPVSEFFGSGVIVMRLSSILFSLNENMQWCLGRILRRSDTFLMSVLR